MQTNAATTEQTEEAKALAAGWKRRSDGTWSKGRGRNFQRVASAKDALVAEQSSQSS